MKLKYILHHNHDLKIDVEPGHCPACDRTLAREEIQRLRETIENMGYEAREIEERNDMQSEAQL